MSTSRAPRTPAVRIRLCEACDLGALEWDGLFAAHREIIAEAFARQRAGTNVMLLAETGTRVAGQVWLDLQKGPPRAARLWAFRVHPAMRGRGIGTRLLEAAEAWLARHGFNTAAIGVEKSNRAARRLYERRGYHVVAPLVEHYGLKTQGDRYTRVTVDQWLLEKGLAGLEAPP